jgi:uncharacterized protein DUF6152
MELIRSDSGEAAFTFTGERTLTHARSMVMKHKLLILLSIVTFLTLGSGQTFAHHSASSVYVHGKAVKIEGTVKEFIWRNPHSFVKVEAPDEKGEMQIWVIEWGAPTQLTEKGLTRTTLRPGDKVLLTGQPGRVAENHRLLMEKVERPSDGWKWEGIVQ